LTFQQQEPFEGEPATEDSDAWILFDDASQIGPEWRSNTRETDAAFKQFQGLDMELLGNQAGS